jgi:hypothetical protein
MIRDIQILVTKEIIAKVRTVDWEVYNAQGGCRIFHRTWRRTR